MWTRLLPLIAQALLALSPAAERFGATGGGGDGDRRCSAAVDEARETILARVRSLERYAKDSVAIVKAELAAARGTYRAGILDLKNALMMQSLLRPRPPVGAVPGDDLKALGAAVAREVAAVSAASATSRRRLRDEMAAEIGRLGRQLKARARQTAGGGPQCSISERLARRVDTSRCRMPRLSTWRGDIFLAFIRVSLRVHATRQRSLLYRAMERQNATMLRLEQRFGCKKESASVRNGTAEVSRPASKFRMERAFRKATTQDLTAPGQPLGPMAPKDCAAQCLLRGDRCRGFLVAPNCSLLMAPGANVSDWRETPTGPTQLWLRRGGGARCNASSFPEALGRSRYRVEPRRMAWPTARDACSKRGGKLVQISSEAERLFVYRLINKAAGYPRNSTRSFANFHWPFGYHIGLYQPSRSAEPRGNWRWYPSMDRLRLPVSWFAGQPDNFDRGEDRGVMVASAGLFNDIDNRFRFPSVCECFVV